MSKPKTMNLIDRVKNILLTPQTEWDVINTESATPQALLMSYVLPLAAAAATGPLLSGFLFPGTLGLTFFLITAVIAFVSTIISYYVSVYIVDSLAPNFGSEKDLNKSAQLVAYSATPSYIAGLLSFIPVIGGLLRFAAWGYSIYIMYSGIGPLKKTQEDKKIVYMVVAFIATLAVMLIVSAILGSILFTTVGLGL
jgi:hypothetical protein